MKTPSHFLCSLAVSLAVAATLAPLTRAVASSPIDLAGAWRFQLDREDAGIEQRWFARDLAVTLRLPGALQNQGFGDDVRVDTKWTGDVGSDRWKQRPEYARYREPGNLKIPFFLQPQKHYVGVAWFQRDIEIPKSWAGKRVVLTLERPHWGTTVWVDQSQVGTNLSLSTPHVYDLGSTLAPGKHRLSIRVDNRVLVGVGDWSHSVSDHTQGNWNGIIGRIELDVTEPVWIEDMQVFPDASAKKVKVKVQVGNSSASDGKGQLEFTVRSKKILPVAKKTEEISWTGKSGKAEFEIELGPKAKPWDEFTPVLYELTATLKPIVSGTSADRKYASSRQVTFGLRDIRTSGRQFVLNGNPVFFRGTLECCIFPLTGYPPVDVESWKRIIRICKEHGLNHMRFHSWCPPEAAFTAADELGFYFQVECGVWTEPGSGKAIDSWLYDESQRIVGAYANHPSFMLLTHGNEPHGPKHKEYLAKWVDFWKPDGRFLVTSGSAYPQLPENQYHVFYPSRGPHGWLGKDYLKDVETLAVPIVVHEMGQWCVYPNFDEMKKYTGPLKPRNVEIFRDSLLAHGMFDQWKDFVRASGKLQTLCYKEEVEAALRTPGIGGVQLLDLHDFPGQGTALVGVLDPFWEEKGYVSAREFRRFYGPVVPLARLMKRTWTTDETLSCEVEVANYLRAIEKPVTTRWKFVADNGEVFARGEFPRKPLPLGQNLSLGKVNVRLNRVQAPQAFRLEVTLSDHWSGNLAENDWAVWGYPAKDPSPVPAPVILTSRPDEALARAESGASVVLLANRLSSEHPRLTFEPIFWNRYMFNTQNRQTLGLLCRPEHPALERFPTSYFQDWQWQDIVTSARGMIMDDLPAPVRPIVQPIDDWNSNRRLGLLFECRVGAGKLLVCSADLEKDLDRRPAARQFRESILAYAASSRFQPATPVTVADLRKMLDRKSASNLVRLGAKVLSVDSEDAESGNVAANAIDADQQTIWHTRWQPGTDPMPHSLTIDLGREVLLRGITYVPRQDMANGRIAEAEISAGNDPRSLGAVLASVQWPNSASTQKVTFDKPVAARFLKITAKSEVNGNPFAAIAELDVITDQR
jgi:hypothetical protein